MSGVVTMAEHKLIDEAFSGNVQLAGRIHDALRDHHLGAPILVEIAEYVRTLRSAQTADGVRVHDISEIVTKKRKLEGGTTSPAEGTSLPGSKTEVVFQGRDISFSIPMRKKLQLEFAQLSSKAPGHAGPVYQIQARNQTSGEVEYKAGMQSFKHALRLPIPEKAQKQYSFVLLPEASLGIGDKASGDGTESKEPLVWTVTDLPHKAITPSDEKLQRGTQAHEIELMEQTLNKCLEGTSASKVIRPDEAEFSSATPEAHRKGENAYHVKAFRGSKDGYLFFLANGIFFGFKKPLAFFPFEAVSAISYTSVLQRTFNLNIAVQLPGQAEVKEHEFSMIDQGDFAGIDSYIRRHGLQDASLAESRKAKKLNINVTKKGGDEDGQEQGQDRGELQKAQQDIEDAEDEEEEDYDPGSEGLSDGSGESSDEGEYDDANAAAGPDGGLVSEEHESETDEVIPGLDADDQL